MEDGQDDGFYAANLQIAQISATLPNLMPSKKKIHNRNASFYSSPNQLITEDETLFSTLSSTIASPVEFDFYKPGTPVYVPDGDTLNRSSAKISSTNNSWDFYNPGASFGMQNDEDEIARMRQQYLYQLKQDTIEETTEEIPEEIPADNIKPASPASNGTLNRTDAKKARAEKYESILEQLRLLADKLPDDSEDSAAVCTLGCIIVDLQSNNISVISTLCELLNSAQLRFSNPHLKPLQDELVSLKNLSYTNFDPHERDALVETIQHTVNYLQFRNAENKESRKSTLQVNRQGTLGKSPDPGSFSSSDAWGEENIWNISTMTLKRSKKNEQGKGISLLLLLKEEISSGANVNVEQLAQLADIATREHGMWGIDQVISLLETALDKPVLNELSIISKCLESLESTNKKRLSARFSQTISSRRKSQLQSQPAPSPQRNSITTAPLSSSPPQSPTQSRPKSTTRRTVMFENAEPAPPPKHRELNWITVSSPSSIPPESDPAGYDFSGEPLYISRIKQSNTYILGKSGHHLPSVVITQAGLEKAAKGEFEVLTDLDGLKWVDMYQYSKLPRGCVFVGDNVVIARAKVSVEQKKTVFSGWMGTGLRTALIPGKCIGGAGAAVVGYDGREYKVSPFEVLVFDEMLE